MTETKALIGAAFCDEVIKLVDAAVLSVKVIMFDWRLYPNQPSHPVSKLVTALVAARRRGVCVQVLLSNAEVRRELSQLGFECKAIYSSKLVHAKVMLVDDVVAIVGSHNYTQNAFTMNLEVSLVAYFNTTENDLKLYFDRLWPL